MSEFDERKGPYPMRIQVAPGSEAEYRHYRAAARPALFVVGANPLFGFVAGVAGIPVTLLLTIGICFFDKKFIRDYQTL